MADYAERLLFSAKVARLSPSTRDNVEGVNANVIIGLAGIDDSLIAGPTVSLSFGFSASHDQSIRSLESEALTKAAKILQRFAQETAETLQAEAERAVPTADEQTVV